MSLQDTPFDVQDLGFLHHFLTRAVHPLPIGNRDAWTKDIPQIAQQLPYLLHAILSLGASLVPVDPGSDHERTLSVSALQHRGRAISGLNTALAGLESWKEPGHADAALATSYVLMYESSNMPDGLHEFLALVKGCGLISQKIFSEDLRTALTLQAERTQHTQEAWLVLVADRGVDATEVALAIQALDDLREAFGEDDNFDFWHALRTTLVEFQGSLSSAFTYSTKVYTRWYMLAEVLVQSLMNTESFESLILVAFYLANMAFLKILIPLRASGKATRHVLCSAVLREALEWVVAVGEVLPEQIQHHMRWPRSIFDCSPPNQEAGSEESRGQTDYKVQVLKNRNTQAHMIVGSILRLGSCMTSCLNTMLTSIDAKRPWDIATLTGQWLEPQEPRGFRKLLCR